MLVQMATTSIAFTPAEKLANWWAAYHYLTAKVEPGPNRDQVMAEVLAQIGQLEGGTR